MVMQQETQRRVQFEITEQTRQSIESWIKARRLKPTDYLFPSRLHASPHISTRQYARLVHRWIASIGLDDTAYGTHHASHEGLIDLAPNEEPPGRCSCCSAIPSSSVRFATSELRWNISTMHFRNLRRLPEFPRKFGQRDSESRFDQSEKPSVSGSPDAPSSNMICHPN